MDYRPEDPGSTQIVYAGNTDVMPLRGPASQLLQLAMGETKRIQWAPTDRRASPIEIFSRLVSWAGDPWSFAAAAGVPQPPLSQYSYGNADVPLIRWRIIYGHGNYTITDPVYAADDNGISGSWPVASHQLPARGLIMRLTPRELTFEVEHAVPTGTTPDTYSPAIVVVSFQPVESVRVPYVTRQASAVGTTSLLTPITPFPAWASEWKLYGAGGQPIPDETAHYVVFALAHGQPFPTSYKRADFADWSPIPQYAAGWRLAGGPTIAASASYR